MSNSSQSSQSVGLIGCSLAGNAITERLVRAGMRVYSHDLSLCPVHSVVRLGAITLDSPAAVAAATPRVILTTSGRQDAETILWGQHGLLHGPRKPTTIIDLDTIQPAEFADIAKRASTSGVELIDAAISGTYKVIGHGEAGLVVGGAALAVNACGDIFNVLAPRWKHVGGAGSAASARVMLAVLIQLQRSALAEALVHAESLGINMAAFSDLVRASPAYSAATDAKSQQMVRREYTGADRIDADLRDAATLRKRALEAGQLLPTVEAHSELLAEVVARGEGHFDVAMLIESVRRRRPNTAASTASSTESPDAS